MASASQVPKIKRVSEGMKILQGWLIVLLMAWLGGVSPLELRAESRGANLIANSGFEAGAEPWQEDNYQHNDVTIQRDTHNPHAGAYAMKVQLNRAIGGTIIQLNYPHLAVRPGMAVEVRFWARGVSNSTPLTLNIRKGAAPWTRYFAAELALSDDWKEYVLNTVLPGDMEPEQCSLTFALRNVGVVWLDDVSVRELPAAEGGNPATINPIRNPSFEAGTDGWTATFRTRDFKIKWEEMGSDAPCDPDAKLEIRRDAGAPQGQRYLSFAVHPNCYAALTSAYFPARYGHKVYLVFSLRADGEQQFSASIGGGKNGTMLFHKKTLTASRQWQKFSVPLTLKPVVGGLYTLQFDFDEPGQYDLDAVSVIEAGVADPVLVTPAVAVQTSSDAPVAQLYSPGQPASLNLVAADQKAGAQLAYSIGIVDYLGRTIATQQVELTADASGYAARSFAVPTQTLGAFKVEARDARTHDLLSEQLYSVLPAIPAPAERPDSFFGGHVDVTPYNLEIARKAGFRWLRFHPPIDTKWRVAEQTPGEWHFRTDNAERAHAMGFRLVGMFDTTPDFAADGDPQNPIRTRWTRTYPPADMNAWKDYVVRCFNTFSPYMDAWEVWNEPDGNFLLVRPGVEKADVYLALLKATREALDSTGKSTTLLGGTLGSVQASLGWQVLDRRGGDFIDGFSFHFYNLNAGGASPDESYVLPILDRYRTYHNREGQPMPLWHTEGGAYLNGAQSWLQTYRIPPSSIVTPPQAAAAMVRAALLFKSMGVKRYFDFQLWASPTGRRSHEDICSSYIDVTGIPGPGIAAHTAMVALTEDLKPAGFDVRIVDGVPVKIARFTAENRQVDVYWSASPVKLSHMVTLAPEAQVRDMMGNSLAAPQAQLSEYPLYVITP